MIRYRCWFPNDGQSLDDAILVDGESVINAAKLAARRRWEDNGYRSATEDVLVVVATDARRVEVLVSARPVVEWQVVRADVVEQLGVKS